MDNRQKQFRTSPWFGLASFRWNKHSSACRIRDFLQSSNRRERPDFVVPKFAFPFAANIGTIPTDGSAGPCECVFRNTAGHYAWDRTEFPHRIRESIEILRASRDR